MSHADWLRQIGIVMTQRSTLIPPSPVRQQFLRFRKHGDVEALASVFDETSGPLLRIAGHLTPDRATADDLVQATFLAAIEGAQSFRPRGEDDLVHWLTGILRNQAKLAARRARRSLDPERLSTEPLMDPVEDAERAELHREIGEAIDALEPVYRPVVQLHLIHGLNAKEIASVLDRPSGTVRTQVVRGVRALRDLLPVGLTGVIAGVLPRVGQAATVRAAVLEAASSHAPQTTIAAATTAAGGGSVASIGSTWKALAACIAVAALVWAGITLGTTDPADEIVPGVAPADGGPVASAANDRDPAASRSPADAATRRDTISRPEAAPFVPRTLAGRVVADETSMPLQGAEIYLWQGRRGRAPVAAQRGENQTPAIRVQADPDGTFSLLCPHREFTLTAVLGDQRICVTSLTGRFSQDSKPDSMLQELELRLAQTATLEGTVLDPQGTPLSNVEVECTPGYLQLPAHRLPADLQQIAPAVAGGIQTTDANGKFSFVCAAHRTETSGAISRCAVHASKHPAYPPKTVFAAAGRGTIQLQFDAARSFAGSVFRAEGGAPAVGAEVCYVGETQRKSATVDATGRFQLGGLCHTTDAYLLVRDEHSAIHAIENLEAEGDDDMRLFLEPSATIRGRVVDAAGVPIEGAKIHLSGDRALSLKTTYSEPTTWEWAHGMTRTRSDEDGVFRVTNLYPGRFELRITHPNNSSIDRTLSADLRPGETAELETVSLDETMSTKRDVELHMEWRGPEAQAFPVAAVTCSVRSDLIDPAVGHNQTVPLDENGHGMLRGIPQTGKIFVSASAHGYAGSNSGWLEIQSLGDNGAITLPLFELRDVTFRIVSQHGKQIDRATVEVLSPEGHSLMLTGSTPGVMTGSLPVDRDGPTTLSALPDSDLTLRISRPGQPPILHPIPEGLRTDDQPVQIEVHAPTPTRVRVFVLGAERGVARPNWAHGALAFAQRQVQQEIWTRKDLWQVSASSVDLTLSDPQTKQTHSTGRFVLTGHNQVAPDIRLPEFEVRHVDSKGGSYRVELDQTQVLTMALEGQLGDLSLSVQAEGYETQTLSVPVSAFAMPSRSAGGAEPVLEAAVWIFLHKAE